MQGKYTITVYIVQLLVLVAKLQRNRKCTIIMRLLDYLLVQSESTVSVESGDLTILENFSVPCLTLCHGLSSRELPRPYTPGSNTLAPSVS